MKKTGWGSLGAALVLVSALVLGLGTVSPARAATITNGPTTATGAQAINPADEVIIYAIQIRRDPPDQERILEFSITLEDLAPPDGPTGLQLTDFNELRIWQSNNTTIGDGGDVVLASIPQGSINIGGTNTFTLGVNLLPAGAGRWYLVTAVLGPGAINGHSFRVGAPANSITVDQDPPGPGGFDGVADLTLNGVLAANNANYFVFGGVNFAFEAGGAADGPYINSEGRGVPMRGIWLAGIAVLAYGAWRASRVGPGAGTERPTS